MSIEERLERPFTWILYAAAVAASLGVLALTKVVALFLFG